MIPPPRAGDRRLTAAERLFYVLIAGVLILWAFLDGGLR